MAKEVSKTDIGLLNKVPMGEGLLNYVFKLVIPAREGTDTDFESCRIGPDYGGVHYKIGKWTVPSLEGSRLLVFESISDVLEFTNRYYCGSDRLFLAEAVDIKKMPFLKSTYGNFGMWWRVWYNYIESLGDDEIVPISKNEFTHAPKGTCGARAVRLVREIYDWRELKHGEQIC